VPTPDEQLEAIRERLKLNELENSELLQGYAAILRELRSRGVLRSSNNPVADYSEWLVCSRLGLSLATKSTKGYDALSADGTKYEIKSRRITPQNSSTQFSAIRQLRARHFDYLVGVIYEPDFRVRYAAQVPFELVEPNCRFSEHANAHLFSLTPAVLALPGVVDLTSRLAA
jgi:hypothetical protein